MPDETEWGKTVEKRYDDNLERFKRIEARLEVIEQRGNRLDRLLDEWAGQGPNDHDALRFKMFKLLEYTAAVRYWGLFTAWLAGIVTAALGIWGVLHK